ncbi:hypothetical protein ACJX0J_040437, partial [Zea mays]
MLLWAVAEAHDDRVGLLCFQQYLIHIQHILLIIMVISMRVFQIWCLDKYITKYIQQRKNEKIRNKYIIEYVFRNARKKVKRKIMNGVVNKIARLQKDSVRG